MRCYYIALAFVLFLTGCALGVDPYNYDQVANGVNGYQDFHDKRWKVQAPSVTLANTTYFLRAFTAPNSKKINSIQLYVSARFSQWAFIDHGYSDGKRLSVTNISKDVGACSTYGCAVVEDVAINLTASEVKAIIKKGGFGFSLRGRGGSVDIVVPASYFQAVVDNSEKNGIYF